MTREGLRSLFPRCFLFEDPGSALKGGVKVCKRPLVNEVLGLLLTESSPIRPTRARHLYSMDSKAAFSFASRFLELIRHGAALEIGAVAITVASLIYSGGVRRADLISNVRRLTWLAYSPTWPF